MGAEARRRGWPRVWALAAALSCLACDTSGLGLREENTSGPLLPADSAAAHELVVPDNYTGPIDPQWPPQRASELEVELSANRLILQHLERGQWGRPSGPPLITVHTSNLHAEEGRIAGFDYIEVIVGETHGASEPLPLVVLLHGRGGRPTIPPGPYGTKAPMRLFIPRGPDKLNGGYNWLATWTNAGKEELLARSLAGRADELAVAIKVFSELRPTLGKPIVVGFSQGGILAFGLAIRHPSIFSAVFPLAGWLPEALIPAETDESIVYPYIHALHGGADKTVPTDSGRNTVNLLRLFGVRIEYDEFPGVGHRVSPEMNAVVRSELGSLVEAMSAEEGDGEAPTPDDLVDEEPAESFTAIDAIASPSLPRATVVVRPKEVAPEEAEEKAPEAAEEDSPDVAPEVSPDGDEEHPPEVVEEDPLEGPL